MRALTCSAQLCLSPLRAIAAKTLRLLATSVALVLAASCGRVGFSALQSSDANANADASVADASSDAGGWWNAAWQFRKKVRFRNAQRNEGFDGMPVAISLPPSIADVADLAQAVLVHRMALSFAARARGETLAGIIARVTTKTLRLEAAA